MIAYSRKAVVVFILLLSLVLSLLAITIFRIPSQQDTPLLNPPSVPGAGITGNSEQGMILSAGYPANPVTVLPFGYDIPAGPGNNLSLVACRNEFEPASFIISARKALSGITITVPALYSAQGNSIPSSATDVRLVKVWYQATDRDDIWLDHIEKTLKPELLLKDDRLVRVDYTNRTNYLRVTINGVEQYIDITSPTAVFPPDARIHDAQTLQPFSLAANENKEIWLTVHSPGEYSGRRLSREYCHNCSERTTGDTELHGYRSAVRS